jgi:hypothetical protein
MILRGQWLTFGQLVQQHGGIAAVVFTGIAGLPFM